MKYRLVLCGGTFDHLHDGHKVFLRAALSLGQQVLIGISSDRYVKIYKKSYTLQKYVERKEAVVSFLRQENALGRVTIVSADSPLGPQEWEVLPIEAIVVTEETVAGAQLVNTHRIKKNLPLLKIISVPLKNADTGNKISSTDIRDGKTNVHGRSYTNEEWFNNDLILPEAERKWFKKPFGTLSTDSSFLITLDREKLVAVGDVVTEECNRKNIGQKLSIIDFIVQRKRMHESIQNVGFTGKEYTITAKNPSGHITISLFSAIKRSIQLFADKNQIIIVTKGEEDLAVIPLVLSLPLGFSIVYGQPNQGIVCLEVTTNTKDTAYDLLQRFIALKDGN